jgi:undecaprenyl-diphosphatase
LGARHPADAARLGVAGLVFASAAIWARGRAPDRGEVEIFRLTNELPAWVMWIVWVPMQLGTLVAVVVFVVVFVVRRRGRVAVLVLLGGLLGWCAARLLKETFEHLRPAGSLTAVIVRGAEASGFGFPSGHCTVAAAIITVAAPYLSPSARRLSWILVGVVAFARMYVGAHLPADVVGGVALGLVVGSMVNLVSARVWRVR